MSYWQDRWAASQNNLSSKTKAAIDKQIKKYYSQTLTRTIADFEDTYMKILLTQQEGKDITPADLYRLDKYWQTQAQLKKELLKLGEKQITLLSKYFEMNYINVYNSLAIPGGDMFSTLDTSTVKQMINRIWCADGKSWSSRIWGNTELLAQRLNDGLIHCATTGQKTSELKKLLMEEFNADYNRADALVRTELAHIQTEAAKQRYEDAGVKEVEIWADKDERRCDVCGKLHKKRYPVGAAVPIPAHPRCRCCILPVVDKKEISLGEND